MAGKLLGPNLIARLVKILPWAESQMGRDDLGQPHKPQILQSMAIRWGKLDATLAYDDTTGVTVSIWSGTPFVDSTEDVEYVLPPRWLLAGEIEADALVWFARAEGEWRVVARDADIYLGKLDANLLYTDTTTGVAVSVWEDAPLADSTRNVSGVLPPPFLTTGQLDSGAWGLIQWISGRWRVTGAPCA